MGLDAADVRVKVIGCHASESIRIARKTIARKLEPQHERIMAVVLTQCSIYAGHAMTAQPADQVPTATCGDPRAAGDALETHQTLTVIDLPYSKTSGLPLKEKTEKTPPCTLR